MSRPFLPAALLAVSFALLGTTPAAAQPVVVTAQPVQNDDIFRAIGVYVWRLQVQLPPGDGYRMALKFSAGKDKVELASVDVPASAKGRDKLPATVIIQFTTASPPESEIMVCTVVAGESVNRVTEKNVVKNYPNMIVEGDPKVEAGEVRLFTLKSDGPEVKEATLSLVIDQSRKDAAAPAKR